MSFPTSVRTVLVLAAVAAAGSADAARAQSTRAQFHPNRVKYSDVGARPASGRSGSASLQARALLGKDGAALLEATTGSLEDGTAPGQLKKMQVKLFASNGTQLQVQNYSGQGTGYWSNAYAGIGRKQTFQLQANVGGIDGNRNDVVTVSTEAVRRPDIAVDAVTAPARALAGTRVNVVGVVSERNGDVGARTTCVLNIDGAVVDQASGIWVDAGHSVSCAFQTVFTTVAQHQVQVYATGVSPADWDDANNSASTSVDVVSPETPLSYSAKFTGSDYDYVSHYKYSSGDGSYLDEKTETGTRKNRALTLSSWTSASTFTFPVKVHSSLASAGTMVFDVTNDVAYDANASWSGGDCGNLYQSGFSITVCNYHYGTVQRSQVDLSSYAGRVTYFGTRYFQNYGWEGYTTNSSGDAIQGVGGYAMGDDVRPILELSDAKGAVFASRPGVSLQSAPINSLSNFCYRNPYNDVTYCSDLKTQGTSRSGSATDTSH
ncbi:MAG: hypothetical protein JWN53_1319 [Gemmatimonadetes bacterium]|nr:hypothetical protein [Gemmatimonadota bacterium]